MLNLGPLTNLGTSGGSKDPPGPLLGNAYAACWFWNSIGWILAASISAQACNQPHPLLKLYSKAKLLGLKWESRTISHI